MNRKYHARLLPHYRWENGTLYFLDKKEVRLTPIDHDIVANLDNTEATSEGILRLKQDGIVYLEQVYPSATDPYLIIAPHSDDAALSLGGMMFSWKFRRPYILNVFSTCVCTVLKGILSTHQEITDMNNKEEEAMATAVGGAVEFLRYPEALLRGYQNWRGAPHMEGEDLIHAHVRERITDYLEKFPRMPVFFPTGIGSHIDHVLLRHVGMDMLKSDKLPSECCFFYEDLPYAAENLETVEETVRVLGKMEEFLFDITDVVREKIHLISIYKTQYAVGDLQLLADHAAIVRKDGKYYERCWRLMK